MERDKIIKFLENPRSYPYPVKKVKHIDTHYLSDVFLTGRFAYKIKKPVNYGYLDFTTLAKRKFFCHQELKLNRRLSSKMYLDVLPITTETQNASESQKNSEFQRLQGLKFGGQGKAVEYVLKMKEIPQRYLMNKLLKKNKITKKIIDKLAQIIAKFHAQAATSKKISSFGSLKIINKNWQENFSQSKPFIGRTIPRADFYFLKRSVEKFINQKKNIFEERIRNKKIRDCHGDLHKGNIFIASEKTYIFDCIDFNERFRYQDVINEIAYFAMEMDFAGKKELSSYFVDQYFKFSKDQKLINLLLFYKCYRAYIRGKVLGFSLNNNDLSKRQKEINRKKAQQYFQLAKKYVAEMQKPVLIIGIGLPGVGKSRRLDLLAKKTGFEILKTDKVRRELKRKIDYKPKSKMLVYIEMLKRAEKILKRDRSLILDASFIEKWSRNQAVELAKKIGIEYFFIKFYADEKTIKKRFLERAKEKRPLSDANWQVFQYAKKYFEPIKNEPNYFKINTVQPPEKCVVKIISQIK